MTPKSPRPRFLDLALVCAALSLGTYLAVTSGGPTSEEVLSRHNNLFSAFSPDTIRTITLLAPGSNVTLRKVEDNPDPHLFFLGPQGQMPADPLVIAELFSTLEYATWLRTLDEKDENDLKKLGFETPHLEVKLDAGARSYRLLFGAAAPFPSQSAYARVHDNSGNTVTGVVPDQLLSKLLRGEQEFRGSSLFIYGRGETSSLSIAQVDETLELHADGLGFLLEQSSAEGVKRIRAERTLTDLIFFQMARASLSSFVEPEFAKKEIAADPHRITITQKSDNAPGVKVLIGGQCPNEEQSTLAIRLTPDVIAGCVTRTILPALRLSPSAIFDLSTVPLNADEIDHVVVSDRPESNGPELKLDLIRSENAFRLLSHQSEEVELSVGQEFLEVLSTGVLEQVSNQPPGTHQTGEIVVKGQSLANGSLNQPSQGNDQDPLIQELHLELFRPTANAQESLWVHRLDDDVWLKVPEPLRWAFETDDSWAKDRQLIHAEADEVLEVTLKNSRGFTQTLLSDGKVATSTTDESVPADPLLSRRLKDELAHLQAVRFIGKTHTTEPVELEIAFQLRADSDGKVPTAEKKLWLGKRTRGGFLAWSNFTSGMFVVSLPTQAVFDTPLASRAPLQIEIDSVNRLTAKSGDRSYRFERRGENLRPSGGGAVEDMVAPLEEAIRGLDVLVRTMNHPDARSLTRGPPQASLEVKLESGEAFTIHIGNPGEWQGMNVHVAWREGETDNYVIGKRSLDTLLGLL